MMLIDILLGSTPGVIFRLVISDMTERVAKKKIHMPSILFGLSEISFL